MPVLPINTNLSLKDFEANQRSEFLKQLKICPFNISLSHLTHFPMIFPKVESSFKDSLRNTEVEENSNSFSQRILEVSNNALLCYSLSVLSNLMYDYSVSAQNISRESTNLLSI